MAFAAFGGGAAQAAGEPAPLRRGAVAIGLLTPGVLYLLLFFLFPFVSLVITSFNMPGASGGKGDYVLGFRPENYVDALTT